MIGIISILLLLLMIDNEEIFDDIIEVVKRKNDI